MWTLCTGPLDPFLVVFVKASLHTHMSEADLQFVCTGAMSGTIGNKGGIGVSLKLFASQICIINAHLAAHMEVPPFSPPFHGLSGVCSNQLRRF